MHFNSMNSLSKGYNTLLFYILTTNKNFSCSHRRTNQVLGFRKTNEPELIFQTLPNYKTKAQIFEHIQYHRTQHLKQIQLHLEDCPIVQSTDVKLNMNKTEPITTDTQNSNYVELINSTKFSLPATYDFILKSPKLYNYFRDEQTEITETFLHETQQHEAFLRQFYLWKKKTKAILLSLL